MTRGSRRSLHPELRYYFLILGSNYSGMENFEANAKDHFTVVNASSHGAVILQSHECTLFKVNGHRLKIFLEPTRPNVDGR
jgi:hypothetical protein